MSRRALMQLVVLGSALLLAAGTQALAAFSAPSVAPQNAAAYAPLTEGSSVQTKDGGLGIQSDLFVSGKVGIGTTKPTAALDVNGKIIMENQTQAADPSDTAVTKGYLKSYVGSKI